MKLITLAIVTGIWLFTAPVKAGSLADKKAAKESDETLQTYVEGFKSKCGTEVKVKIDWESFKKNYKENYNHRSAAHYCGSVAEGIADLCAAGDDEKKAVTGKIKEVTCKFDPKLKDNKLKEELKGSAVKVELNWDSGNIATETKAWLGNTL